MSESAARKPFAKKSFGQNFLTDGNYIDKIIDALDLSAADTVVEIGPGRGALTERLLDGAGEVIAIELDRDLIPLLQDRFGRQPNFHLREQDALTIDFHELLLGLLSADAKPSTSPTARAKLVANLPYYISTAILQRLIEQREVFSQMVLMFQREVVERIMARPGSTDRGFLTVMVEAYLEAEKLFDVPPAAFRPVPKVWSSVIRFRPRTSTIADEELFRRVVSLAFAQKRKTILNNLKSHFPDAAQMLVRAGIETNRRAETLTADEWSKLVSSFHNGS